MRAKTASGKLVVIDGIDGSGKTDQTRFLVERLKREGHDIKTISFPTYGKLSAKGVELYLNGDLGSPDEIGPYYGSMFYAHNRRIETLQMREDLKRGTSYVLNRYVSANGGHQGGKIFDDGERQRFLRWLFELEFVIFKIPKPDLNILLHMPAAIGQVFVERKVAEQRAYLKGKKKDVHEADINHLINAEKAYLFMAKEFPDWKIVSCVKPGLEGKLEMINDKSIPPEQKVRAPEDIHEEIYRIVKSVFS